jgi:hypothetical protein
MNPVMQSSVERLSEGWLLVAASHTPAGIRWAAWAFVRGNTAG